MANAKWLVCIHFLLLAATSTSLNVDEIQKVEEQDYTSKIEQDAPIPKDDDPVDYEDDQENKKLDANYDDSWYLQGLDNVEGPSLAKRTCPRKCSDTCYDPVVQQCCNDLLLHGFFSCSDCKGMKKCGERCYPKIGYKCCYNKVIPNGWTCCSHHCGSACYNAQTHKCCAKKIIPRSMKCCIKPAKYCGNNCYDPKLAKCCYDRVIDIKAKCCLKCAGKCYDPKAKKCCNKNIISIAQLCCKPGENACEKKCYNPTSQKCCNKIIIPIAQLCCKPGEKACEKKCYNPKSQKCCYKIIIPIAQLCCKPGEKACEKTCYNPTNQKCCKGQPIPQAQFCGVRRRITRELWAKSLGCYRDHGNRAIPTLEGHDRLLVGNYQQRKYAIEKCALAAARRGWKYFAVQHQGWCASSSSAGSTYNKYLRYNTCRNGKGGPWGNDVYVLQGAAAEKTTGGEVCVFPFIYKGVHYNGCTTRDHGRPWCAVTPNYDVDRLRGDCVIRCPHLHALCGIQCYNTIFQKCCSGNKLANKWGPCSGWWGSRRPFGR